MRDARLHPYAICDLTRPPQTARLAVAGTFALLLLELLWELVLAPLRAHPSWLALKALPLALLLPGTARGARRPRQWLSLLLPFYIAEALGRTLAEHGRHALVAGTACFVAAATFVALLAWFRKDAVDRAAARSDAVGDVTRGRRAPGAKSLRHRKHDGLDDA